MTSIRRLEEADDRSDFRSGDIDLDRFFQKHAGRNQFVHHIGTTYVAVEGARILGFATVAAASLHADDVADARVRRLPRYPLPVLRLARMAVRQTSQRRGLGSRLLRYVFRLGLAMSETIGCIGIVVDAKPPAVNFYTKYGFQPLQAVEGNLRSPQEPAPMFLHIDSIRAARK